MKLKLNLKFKKMFERKMLAAQTSNPLDGNY